MPRSTSGNRQLIRNFGTQLSFNGTTAFVNCGSDTSLNTPNTLTVSCWAKARNNTSSTISMFVAKDGSTGSARSWSFGILNGKAFVEVRASDASATQLVQSSTNLIDSNWHFYTFVYNFVTNGTSTLTLYIDGVQANTTSSAVGPIQTGTAEVDIGRRVFGGANAFFSGSLDEVQVYNGILTSTQIQQLYYQGATISGAGLVSYYKFDEGSGTSATDSAGTNTGTITAATYVTDPPLGITTRTTVPSQIDLTGLVAWWTMRDSDFGTTTLTNEVAGGMNLTLTSPKWVTGNGNALEYNQTSQSVGSGTIAANDLLDFSSATAMTVIGRINFTGAGGNGNGRLIGAAFCDHVLKQGSIFSLLSTTGTNTRWAQSFTPADNTTWVALTYNSTDSSFRLIIDGVQAAVTTTNQTGVFNTGLTGAFKLGADTNVTSVPKGWIYEVAIFKNRALTAAECGTFAQARRPAITSGTRTVVT